MLVVRLLIAAPCYSFSRLMLVVRLHRRMQIRAGIITSLFFLLPPANGRSSAPIWRSGPGASCAPLVWRRKNRATYSHGRLIERAMEAPSMQELATRDCPRPALFQSAKRRPLSSSSVQPGRKSNGRKPNGQKLDQAGHLGGPRDWPKNCPKSSINAWRGVPLEWAWPLCMAALDWRFEWPFRMAILCVCGPCCMGGGRGALGSGAVDWGRR